MRRLRVLLVLEDSSTLRHCTRLLQVFGFDVNQAVTFDQAMLEITTARPDIVILDGTSANTATGLDLVRAIESDRQADFIYKFLLVHEPKSAELIRAIELGVDDFLMQPIEHGELLSRLRTAARVLEYERRLERQRLSGGAVRLLNREGFIQLLETQLNSPHSLQNAKGQIACLLVSIDRYQRLQTQHGQMQIEPAKQAILSQLVTNAKIPHSIAELNEHTYAAITIGELADTLALAETICSQVTEHAAFTLGATDRITLSIGLAFAPNQTASESTHSATALLDQAEHALRQAIQSGGNSIVQFGQFAEEEAGWAELATTGKLFEYTLARDIMVPSSLSLNHRDTIAQAAELFQQTQLRALPVVDEEGKLAGLLSASAVQSQLAKPNGGNLPANSVMTVDVVSFDEQTTLTALIDYFTQESPLVIVIVNKGRPTGLVTPSSLATLCEQLTTETFAGTPEHSSLLAGLVVPNLCGVDAE